MSVHQAKYECKKCGCTKTIVFDSARVGRPYRGGDFPETLICGVGGCKAIQRRVPITENKE